MDRRRCHEDRADRPSTSWRTPCAIRRPGAPSTSIRTGRAAGPSCGSRTAVWAFSAISPAHLRSLRSGRSGRRPCPRRPRHWLDPGQAAGWSFTTARRRRRAPGPGAGSVFTISFPPSLCPRCPWPRIPPRSPCPHGGSSSSRTMPIRARHCACSFRSTVTRCTRPRMGRAASTSCSGSVPTPRSWTWDSRLRWLRSRAAHPGHRGQREALPHRGDRLWSTRGSGTGAPGGIQLSSRQAGSSKPDQYPAAKPRHGVAGSHRGRGTRLPGRDANMKLLRP